jgi:hypothetical protein
VRLPPRVRLVPLVASVAAATVLLSGCNGTRRELTVVFTPGTTADQRAAVQRACADAAPHASPEPIPTPSGRRGIERSSLVRFRIDSANDRDIARLEECLQKQPGVQGFQDSAA